MDLVSRVRGSGARGACGQPAYEVKAGPGATQVSPPPSTVVPDMPPDNLNHLRRAKPRPQDAAALQPARADLEQAFQELRAQGLYDDASVRTGIARYKSLDGARVHLPGMHKTVPADATAMVWLSHETACLIGEHGPTRSIVDVVGMVRDGGCEALYGH